MLELLFLVRRAVAEHRAVFLCERHGLRDFQTAQKALRGRHSVPCLVGPFGFSKHASFC